MSLLDIAKEFNDLKSAATCIKCKNILTAPMILKTCNHLVCQNCVKKMRKCPRCKSNFLSRDLEKSDQSTFDSMHHINNIDLLLKSTGNITSTHANDAPTENAITMLAKSIEKDKNPCCSKDLNRSKKKVEDLMEIDMNSIKLPIKTRRRPLNNKDENKDSGVSENLANEANTKINRKSTKKKPSSDILCDDPKKKLAIEKEAEESFSIETDSSNNDEMENKIYGKNGTNETKNASKDVKRKRNSRVVQQNAKAVEAVKASNSDPSEKEIEPKKLRKSSANELKSAGAKMNDAKTISEFNCAELGPNIVKVITGTIKRNMKGETPLHLACKRNKLDEVRQLAASGFDVNSVDWANWTPLHEAVNKRAFACTKVLLEMGCLVDIPGENYETPLHKVVSIGDVEMTKLLLEYGADPDAKIFSGKDAIDLCQTNEITSLLTKGKCSSIKTPYYFTPAISKVCAFNVSKETHSLLKSKNYSLLPLSNRDVSLLILGHNESVYSINALISILKGIMIIKEKDLEAFIEKAIPICIDLIPPELKLSLTSAIKQRLQKLPKLFNGMNFYIINHAKPVTINTITLKRSDLIEIIKEGGGKVLVREPAVRTVENFSFFPYHATGKLSQCCHYIVYDEQNVPMLKYNMPDLRHVSSKWLIDCILNNKIMEI